MKTKLPFRKIGGLVSQYRLLVPTLVILLILGAIAIWAKKELPNPKKLSSGVYPESSRIYDRNGVLLYEIYADKRRVPVKLNQVPKSVIDATLAIEDANFWHHPGFDMRGIFRAIYKTVSGKRVEGGSTLTQQLVKNALLTPERTVYRKIKEMVLTLVTELTYSKEQILEMYLNQTPYGGTMWGIEAAANGIFNKSAKNLTTAEAALIAGLPGSPTRYSPFSHPEAAKNRQKLVIARMVDTKYLTSEQAKKVEAEPLNYYLSKTGIKAPHFVFYVKDNLMDKYGWQKVSEGGLKVVTSLDYKVQQIAEEAISSELQKLTKMKVSNGAAMIANPRTGEILAMVGSKDYFAPDIDGKYNVVTALRQPGSSIKPINYAVAIEMGKITPASVFIDQPTCFQVAKLKPYCPTNYGNHYFGVQTTRNSLANSLNIPAVKTLELVGLKTFIASATAFGIDSFSNPDNYGLSLTLGGGEVTMMSMVKAFGVLANGGIRQDLIDILEVKDNHGEQIYKYKQIPGARVLSRETSYIMSQLLSDDGARSMVFGRGSMLVIKGHPEVSVKTGTTNEMKDNWTIGYTPDLVMAVWVGNNNNVKMGGLVSGTTGAAPIFNKIMSKVLEDKPIRKISAPGGVKTVGVCNLTGKLPPEGGCDMHNEIFKAEFVPKERMGLRQNVIINKDNGQIVKPNEEVPNAEWQDRMVVEDVTGAKYCLDCPPVADNTGQTANN
ncbi:MAG: PBP1A family penicillin-binding protein [Candidatus Shapirobacteria bacterium]